MERARRGRRHAAAKAMARHIKQRPNWPRRQAAFLKERLQSASGPDRIFLSGGAFVLTCDLQLAHLPQRARRFVSAFSLSFDGAGCFIGVVSMVAGHLCGAAGLLDSRASHA